MKILIVVVLIVLCQLSFGNNVHNSQINILNDENHSNDVKAFNYTLQDIGNRINATGSLSGYSLGYSDAWKYLLEALLIAEEVYTEIELYHLKLQYSNQNGALELIVQGETTVWNQTNIAVLFVIFIDDDLEIALEFDFNATAIPDMLWPDNNYNSWFSGLSLVGDNTASFSTETFTDNRGFNFYQGLSIVANILTNENLPVNAELGQLMTGQNNSQIPIHGKLVAQFPLSFSAPLTSWTLTLDGTIYFGSVNVHSSDLVLAFQLTDSSADISLSCDVTIEKLGGDGSTPVVFGVQSDITTYSGFTFQGTLEGKWPSPFGMNWMTFNNLQINFQLDPVVSPVIAQLTFNGGLNLVFSNSSDPITVTFNGEIANDCQQIEFDVEVPTIDFVQLFDGVFDGKQQPVLINELSVSGNVNFIFSTYAGQYQKGFTINGNVQVEKAGTLANAINAISSLPPIWNYAFQLYVPIFSQTPQDISFYLTETGPIPLVENVLIMEGYHIAFTINPQQVTLSSTVFYNNTNIVMFAVEAEIQDQQNVIISFTGTMEGTWMHPLGLTWLNIADTEFSLTVNNGVPQAFSIEGTCNITWGNLNGASVTIIIPGPTFTEFSFSLSVFINNMQQFLVQITDPSRVPAITSEITFAGTLVISTFAHDDVVAGILGNGEAILPAGGNIARTFLCFNSQSAMMFDFAFSFPIFSSSPWDVSFSLEETGKFTLGKSITVNSISVGFMIGESPYASASVDSYVLLNNNPSPFHIIFAGDISLSELSVSGTVIGNWVPYQNFNYITANSATGVLVFQDLALQSFGISGSCNISIMGSTEASFNLTTMNDFFDTYFVVETYTITDLGDFIKAVTGESPPPIIGSLITITNEFWFSISTFSTAEVHEGLTIGDTVTISGIIQEKLKVFDQYGDVDSNKYGMALSVPIFPEQDPYINVELDANFPIRVSKNILFTEFELDITTQGVDINMMLEAVAFVNFTNNPELQFGVSGSFNDDGDISVGGYMVGQWDNMFGLPSVNVSDVEFELGFNPALCGVDLCISELGIGYNLTFGTEMIAFYGSVEVPNLWDMFLEAEIKGEDGMAFTFRDVALEWNSVVGNEISLPIDINSVPANWGFKDTFLYIAPESGNFNNIYYQQGFMIDTGFTVIGLDTNCVIQLTDENFYFNIQINISNFEYNLKEALGYGSLNDPETIIIAVSNVTITDFTCRAIAQGDDSVFTMDYIWWGNAETATINVPILDLYMGFDSFFQKYLSGLFG